MAFCAAQLGGPPALCQKFAATSGLAPASNSKTHRGRVLNAQLPSVSTLALCNKRVTSAWSISLLCPPMSGGTARYVLNLAYGKHFAVADLANQTNKALLDLRTARKSVLGRLSALSNEVTDIEVIRFDSGETSA